MNRVVIIDDHSLFRLTLKSIIEQDINLEVFADYSNSKQALEKTTRDKADIYLIDLELENENGFDIIEKLREINCHAKLVIITMHKQNVYIQKGKEIALDGLIYKDECPFNLLQLINKIASGNSHFGYL